MKLTLDPFPSIKIVNFYRENFFTEGDAVLIRFMLNEWTLKLQTTASSPFFPFTLYDKSIVQDCSMFDILQWLNGEGATESSELKESYHIGESNCQHFAANVWHQLTGKQYPNPTKFDLDTPGCLSCSKSETNGL